MYRLMRNTHLFLGLACAFALAVYLVSSVRLAHRSWFSWKPTVTKETYKVDPSQAGTPRALGMHLFRQHGLRGDIARIEAPRDGAFRFVVRHLGAVHQVRYEVYPAEAEVMSSRLALTGMLLSRHFSYVLWHEDAAPICGAPSCS